MDHIESNRDAFEPYMEDDESFDNYLRRMRGDAEWGGHQELVAASQLYKVRVIESGGYLFSAGREAGFVGKPVRYFH